MFQDCYYQTRPIMSVYNLRAMRNRDIGRYGCCGWWALIFGMFGECMTTTQHLRAVEKLLPDTHKFNRENGLIGPMYWYQMHSIVLQSGYELRKVCHRSLMDGTLELEACEPDMDKVCNREQSLWLFLRVLQQLEDLEVGSKFLLIVDNKSHAICVIVNSQRKVCLADQTGSCLLENMFDDDRFVSWIRCYDYALFRFVPGDSESARASAQAVYEAYARVTGGAFALRRARRSRQRSAGAGGPARAGSTASSAASSAASRARTSTLRLTIRKVAVGVRGLLGPLLGVHGLLSAARRRCAVARRVVARHVAKCT